MDILLQLFVWIPVFFLVPILFVSRTKEKTLTFFSITSSVIQFFSLTTFCVLWLFKQQPELNHKHLVIYQTGDIEIFIDFFFDDVTAFFGLMGALIAFLILVFSKYYLHRDRGFKRYFILIQLFIIGYNLIVFSGNFETLFIGWEIIGISSFLLISYYRERYLPVKNALKVISIYRLSDIFLMLAMWLSHHLWLENITFTRFHQESDVLQHIGNHQEYAVLLSVMIILAAAIKSAQFPFSHWMPRAMEGPTTSSSLFYGSLSAHIGVFLLLRTYPYWHSIVFAKVLIVIIGGATAVFSMLTARVQSSVKAQIAYASIAQIGLMFIEVAVGWHWLVLLHFGGNALFRSYQLLVSPSVLGYRIHQQMFLHTEKTVKTTYDWWYKIKNSIYLFSLKEWNTDDLSFRFLWMPFKTAGVFFRKMMGNNVRYINLSLIVGALIAFLLKDRLSELTDSFLTIFFAAAATIITLLSFTERGSAQKAWLMVVGAQICSATSIALLNEDLGHNHLLIYFSGSIISAITGVLIFKHLKKRNTPLTLHSFHGNIYKHPKSGLLFLLAALGMLGLPLTPSFIGIDLLFSHIHKKEIAMIILTSLTFLFMELAVLRIYCRVFLGPYSIESHPSSYRSA